MMAWAALSVMPTCAAMSRPRIAGSLAMQTSTWPWFVRNVQPGRLGLSAPLGPWPVAVATRSSVAPFVKVATHERGFSSPCTDATGAVQLTKYKTRVGEVV